ncbi:MAG: Ig-like domain-containing protein, partial [Candidatus Scatosoma sp.]
SPGTTVVSVSAKGLSKQCTIIVNQREVEEIIVFDRERIDLFVGDLFSYEFSSTVADDTALTFVSSLPEVAEVSESATVKNGKASMQLKALTCGETTVSVNFNGKTANILVRVSNEVELYLNAPEEIVASSETPYKLNWSLKINGEAKENSENIIWTSSNESVATVTDGTLTAKAYGDVTISLAYRDEYTECSKSINVEIYNGIGTAEEFTAMRSSGKAERYALTSDIDFGGQNIPKLTDTKWTGVFNGNGYTLKNFVIGESENGLFPYMQAGSSVCNVSIVGAEVSASSWGGVVTNRNDGTISDIYLEVLFTNASTSVNNPNGGIAARNVVNTSTQTAVIKNCVVVADASPSLSEAQKKTIGAVVGYQTMKPLENCYAIALADGIELRNRRGVDTTAADCNDGSYFTDCRLFANAADAYEFDFSQNFGENWNTNRGKLPTLAGWKPKTIGNSLGYNSVKMGAGNTLTVPFTAEGFYSVSVQTDATGNYTFENSVLNTESELPNGTKFTFTASLICDPSVRRTFTVEIGEVVTAAKFAP